MMAAAAFNMRHWMNKNALPPYVSGLLAFVRCLENVLLLALKSRDGREIGVWQA